MYPDVNEVIADHYGRAPDPDQGTFGIEIEVEGMGLVQKPPKQWTVHAEGSLRGEAVEYLFTKPLDMDDTHQALTDLDNALKKAGSVVHMSNRTSVHVHYNVNPKKMVQVYTAIAAYFLLENLLVRYAGAEREGNLFCLRISDAEMQMIDLKVGLRGGVMFRGFNEDKRYAALNLASVNQHGSIEFRTFRGTVDPDEIMAWCQLLHTVITRAHDQFKSPLELAEYYEKHGPAVTLSTLTPFWFRDWAHTQPDWDAQIDMNFNYVIQLATCIDWDAAIAQKPAAKRPKEKYKINNPFQPADNFQWVQMAPAPVLNIINVFDEDDRRIQVLDPNNYNDE